MPTPPPEPRHTQDDPTATPGDDARSPGTGSAPAAAGGGGTTRRRALLLGAGAVGVAAAAGVGLTVATRERGPDEEELRAQRIFDAKIDERGLDGYRKLIPERNREGYGFRLERDPRGEDRQVVTFTSQPDLTLGNEYPRSMVETPAIIKAAAHGNSENVYYNGISFLVEDEDFTQDDWITLFTGGYGPPSNGPSFLGMMLVRDPSGGIMFRMGDEPRLLGTGAHVPTGRWVGLVQGYKYAYARDGGWVRLWLDTDGSWREILVDGQQQPTMDVMRPGVTDGWYRNENVMPSFSRIGVYGSKPYEASFGHHRIARSFEAAAPWQ